MDTAQTDPLFHKTETGKVVVRGTTYNAIIDPRSRYFDGALQVDGAAWSPEHAAYIMPEALAEEFTAACERIESMPWRPLDDKLARYCSDGLYQMGILSIQQPVFADNPTGPKKKVYVAPNEELFAKASDLIFEASRITDEQLAKLNAYIASGQATPTILEGTPREFQAKVAARQIDQSEAKRMLRCLEPAPQEAINELVAMVKDGRVTASILGFDPEAQPERMQGLKANEAYDVIKEGRSLATNDLKKRVMAYQSTGAFGEREIYLDKLTASAARSLIKTGQVFVNQDEFERALDSVNRDGFAIAGQTGAYGQRLSSAGTDQGAFEQSLEKMNALIRNGEIEGLHSSAKALEFPPHGYVAGGVAWASSQHAILVVDEQSYIPVTRKDIALEKGLDLRDRLGDFVAFACTKTDKPFGMRTDATSVGQAICEMDARQTLQRMSRDFKAAQAPTQPVTGQVIAMRGDFAALDLGEAGVLTVPKEQLNDPKPRFNATVVFEPQELALSGQRPSRARSTPGRGAR